MFLLISPTKEWRLLYIDHGLKEARKRFNRYVKESKNQNSLSIDSSLNELLLWINLADEWHFLNNNENDYYRKLKSTRVEGQYVNGLRFAFNSIKHEMTFIKLFKPIGTKEFSMDPSLLVEDYSTDLIWLEADKLIDFNPKYRTEREYYKTFIEGKNVVETVNAACRLLHELYFELQSEKYKGQK